MVWTERLTVKRKEFRLALLWLCVGLFVWSTGAQAETGGSGFGFEPYFQVGNIDFESGEEQGNTHKALIGIGTYGHYFSKTLHYTARIEKWALAEANDEDMNVVHDAFRLGLGVDWPFRFRNFTVAPLLGFTYRFMNREPQGYAHFNELTMYELQLGVRGEAPFFFGSLLLLQAALLAPLELSVDYGPTPDAGPGFDLQAGVEWKSARFVFFYERIDMSDPKYRFNLLGLRVGYMFSL